MPKFPVDAPKQRVIKTLESLGFGIIREKEHVSMERINPDGTKTPLTMPNHPKLKASTLRTICTKIAVFMSLAYEPPDPHQQLGQGQHPIRQIFAPILSRPPDEKRFPQEPNSIIKTCSSLLTTLSLLNHITVNLGTKK